MTNKILNNNLNLTAKSNGLYIMVYKLLQLFATIVFMILLITNLPVTLISIALYYIAKFVLMPSSLNRILIVLGIIIVGTNLKHFHIYSLIVNFKYIAKDWGYLFELILTSLLHHHLLPFSSTIHNLTHAVYTDSDSQFNNGVLLIIGIEYIILGCCGFFKVRNYYNKPPILFNKVNNTNEYVNHIDRNDNVYLGQLIIKQDGSANIDVNKEAFNIDVSITDKEFNQHALVIGTTGSGKTTTLMNIVASCCAREVPLVYIDGKGSISLVHQMRQICNQYGRRLKVFSLDEYLNLPEMSHYNPFSCGNFTEWKNKIITLALDADSRGQEHYSLQEQNYLSLVCEILYNAQVYVDLEGIIAYLKSPDELQKLANRVSSDLAYRFVASGKEVKHSSDLLKILEIFYYSSYGKLFSTSNIKRDQLIDLQQCIENGEIVLFMLNAASFKADTKMLGRLIINDINSVWSYFGANGVFTKGYCVFDEFAAYASPNMASILSLQRGNGLHAIIGTQSINAISVESNTIKRIAVELIANCNTFIIHKLNDSKDIELLVKTIGTEKLYNISISKTQKYNNFNGSVYDKIRGWISYFEDYKVNNEPYSINTSYNLKDEYIIDPQKIRLLAAGEAFVCRTSINARPQKVKVYQV